MPAASSQPQLPLHFPRLLGSCLVPHSEPGLAPHSTDVPSQGKLEGCGCVCCSWLWGVSSSWFPVGQWVTLAWQPGLQGLGVPGPGTGELKPGWHGEASKLKGSSWEYETPDLVRADKCPAARAREGTDLRKVLCNKPSPWIEVSFPVPGQGVRLV